MILYFDWYEKMGEPTLNAISKSNLRLYEVRSASERIFTI